MKRRGLVRRGLLARSGQRGVTAVEAAVTFAIGGAVLAVSVPSFVRELAASRFVEPVSGVQKMADLAVAYAHDRPVAQAFPASAPLTPSAPPRAAREVDPPGAWDQGTWKELGFRPVAEGTPHAFAFAFDSTLNVPAPLTPGAPVPPQAPMQSTFVAHAHGDLDGDGITSTFEVRGHAMDGEPSAIVEPGMLVEAEVE